MILPNRPFERVAPSREAIHASKFGFIITYMLKNQMNYRTKENTGSSWLTQ
jgi:hypothetical protein